MAQIVAICRHELRVAHNDNNNNTHTNNNAITKHINDNNDNDINNDAITIHTPRWVRISPPRRVLDEIWCRDRKNDHRDAEKPKLLLLLIIIIIIIIIAVQMIVIIIMIIMAILMATRLYSCFAGEIARDSARTIEYCSGLSICNYSVYK